MRLAHACVLASAAAFFGSRAPIKGKQPQSAQASPARSDVALQRSSARAEESGSMDLSQGAGMFTSSNPEDRRIGQELHGPAS